MPGDGPIPKPSDQRRRRNKPDVPVVKGKARGGVEWPEPGAWHPTATQWYVSLQASGQSQFYEASDVATAVYVAEAMSRSLESSRMSSQMFAAVMAAMSELLTTEGARRRARIELEREEPVAPPSASIVKEYRLSVVGGGE